jgi:hypothetical protein
MNQPKTKKNHKSESGREALKDLRLRKDQADKVQGGMIVVGGGTVAPGPEDFH